MSADSVFTAIIRNKKAKIALIVFLAITLLRESGVLKISYHTSDIKRSASTNWSVSSSDASFEVKNTDTIMNAPLAPVKERVAVYYEDECLWGDCESKTIKAKIDNVDCGFLWLPLYKSASFHVDVSSNFSIA